MKVLHVYNLHRGRGGSDDVTRAMIALCRSNGYVIEEFIRDSRDLASGIKGRMQAFAGGLYASGAVREFRTRLQAFRPDIVHVHELYPMVSPWVLPVAREAGVPVVASINDYRLTCPVGSHFRQGRQCTECLGGREYRCVVRNCRRDFAESVAYALRNASARRFAVFHNNVDRYIALSDFLRDWLVRHAGIGPEKVAVIPPVVQMPRDATRTPGMGTYAAYAGRLVPEKGVLTLIDAARQAGVPLRIGTDAGMMSQLNVDQDMIVYNRDQQATDRFYQGARFLVVPSEWNEPFGRVVIEAMSHGRPVIGSNAGALAENIIHETTGLHFRAGDVADLAQKMQMLWRDPDRCDRLGSAAARRAAAEYNGPDIFRRINESYQAVLGRR